MDKYNDGSSFELWINTLGTRMDIRQRYNGSDSKLKAIANQNNYVALIAHWIKQKITIR